MNIFTFLRKLTVNHMFDGKDIYWQIRLCAYICLILNVFNLIRIREEKQSSAHGNTREKWKRGFRELHNFAVTISVEQRALAALTNLTPLLVVELLFVYSSTLLLFASVRRQLSRRSLLCSTSKGTHLLSFSFINNPTFNI